jgi:hypothetical protein
MFMEKNIEFKIAQSGESVTVGVSTHDDFLPCKEDMRSPFKHGKTILPPEIDPSKYRSVVIKCIIEGKDRTKVGMPKLSGESICHEVVEQFVKDYFGAKKTVQTETVFCNHYEMQYKYIIAG